MIKFRFFTNQTFISQIRPEQAARTFKRDPSRLTNMINAGNSSTSLTSASGKGGVFRSVRSLITRLRLGNNVSNVRIATLDVRRTRGAENTIYAPHPVRAVSKPQRQLPPLPVSTYGGEALRGDKVDPGYESVRAYDRVSLQSVEIIYQNREPIYDSIDPIYSNGDIDGADEPLYYNREAIDRNNADGYEGGVPLAPPPINMATHPPKRISAVLDDLVGAAYKKNQDAKVTDHPPGLLNSDKKMERIRNRIRG
jgi:hypothetical protein